MGIRGKSEGKFGIKEGISINGSNSSSCNNNISMRVIMKSRVNRLEEHYSLYESARPSLTSTLFFLLHTNASEYPSPVSVGKSHSLLGSRRIYISHQIPAFQRTSYPLVLPGSTPLRLCCGFDPCLRQKEGRGP